MLFISLSFQFIAMLLSVYIPFLSVYINVTICFWKDVGVKEGIGGQGEGCKGGGSYGRGEGGFKGGRMKGGGERN